ncbi:hypothetical protein J6590_090204, partial [Homalodisca vitripennis]
MLRSSILPAINEFVQGSYDPVFQQGDAPPHDNVFVRAFLYLTFSDRQIGLRAAMVEWPALLNFFGHPEN